MPEKTCVVCGEDCSTRPRTKDARGRYYCTPCYQGALEQRKKVRADQSRPPAEDAALGLLPPDDAGGMEWLQEALPTQASGASFPCPGCGASLAAGSVLCTSCGYNMQTGATLQVKTYAAPKKRAASAFAAGAFIHPGFVALAIILLYGVLSLAALQSQSDGAIVAFAGWHVICSLTVTVIVLVAAFRESIAQGFLTLCVPCYVLYFVFAVADSAWVRWLFGANLIGAFVAGATSAAIDTPIFYP